MKRTALQSQSFKVGKIRYVCVSVVCHGAPHRIAVDQNGRNTDNSRSVIFLRRTRLFLLSSHNSSRLSHILYGFTAITLLAPGNRCSLTYGSARPLESIGFKPWSTERENFQCQSKLGGWRACSEAHVEKSPQVTVALHVHDIPGLPNQPWPVPWTHSC